MTPLFVDASVFVAIIAAEPDGERYLSLLQDEDVLLWSAMSCWETISSLRNSHKWSIDGARSEVELSASLFGCRLVAIGEAERRIALDAYAEYGKGSRHRARLNMGDCFSYACAKTNGARLLYKGDDFIHTDLA